MSGKQAWVQLLVLKTSDRSLLHAKSYERGVKQQAVGTVTGCVGGLGRDTQAIRTENNFWGVPSLAAGAGVGEYHNPFGFIYSMGTHTSKRRRRSYQATTHWEESSALRTNITVLRTRVSFSSLRRGSDARPSPAAQGLLVALCARCCNRYRVHGRATAPLKFVDTHACYLPFRGAHASLLRLLT